MADEDNRYKKWENWKPRRWAWEFLIRNEKFLKRCDMAKSIGEVEQKLVADEFGLKKFKHYAEPFSRNKNDPKIRAPKFIRNAISVFANTEMGDIDRKVRITLRPGNVAIVFDVSNGAINGKGLERQLGRAMQSLYLRAMKYSTFYSQRSTEQKLDSNRETFLKYLKLLDAKRKARTGRGATKLTNTTGRDPEDHRDSTKNALARAEEICREDYLNIALIEEAPSKPVSPASLKKSNEKRKTQTSKK